MLWERREREEERTDRARWRPSHCRLGVITAHHTTVRGEQRTLKSYLTSKRFHLLFPKVNVLPMRWSLSSLQFKVSDLRWESTVWKLHTFCYSKQVIPDILPKLWCARWPRTQYYLVFLLTVQTINNHWESSLHQAQGWPGQSSQPMIVSTLRKEVLLPSQLSIDNRYEGNEDRTEQILESNWLLKIFEKFSTLNTEMYQHVDKMINMYIYS